MMSVHEVTLLYNDSYYRIWSNSFVTVTPLSLYPSFLKWNPKSGSLGSLLQTLKGFRSAVWPLGFTPVTLTWPCSEMDSLWMMIRSQEERFCPMETGLTRWGRVWWSVKKSYERNINTTAPWSTSVWTTNWTLGLVKKNNHYNIKYMDSSCNSPKVLDMSQRYLNLMFSVFWLVFLVLPQMRIRKNLTLDLLLCL